MDFKSIIQKKRDGFALTKEEIEFLFQSNVIRVNGKEDKNEKIDVINMHAKTPFPSVRKINPAVPEKFENIIYKCCEKDPLKRYKNVNEMYCELLVAYDDYKNPKKVKKSFFERLFKRKG